MTPTLLTMMQADVPALLDACVLAPPRLCDLFLRLAEHPRQYRPAWSDQILKETHKVQTQKLTPPFSQDLAAYWHREVTRTFPEAMISSHSHLIPLLDIDEQDRHVLAAAIHGKISTIVTFNVRHFPKPVCEKWGVRARHPEDFMIDLYSMNPSAFMGKLVNMAEDINQPAKTVLRQLSKLIPRLVEYVTKDLALEDEGK